MKDLLFIFAGGDRQVFNNRQRQNEEEVYAKTTVLDERGIVLDFHNLMKSVMFHLEMVDRRFQDILFSNTVIKIREIDQIGFFKLDKQKNVFKLFLFSGYLRGSMSAIPEKRASANLVFHIFTLKQLGLSICFFF